MTRLSLFNSPLMLGFEQFEQALDRISKTSADGYPPYNVEQIGENRLRITLAVAGFTADDLHVQIQDKQLVFRGKQDDEEDKVFLREYAEALKKFAAGIRDVIFPAGTYWMRVHFGVECRAPP